MVLQNIETKIIKSEIVGDSFELFISLPDNYFVSGKIYPVIYLLDANLQFAMVTQIARLLNFGSEIPEVIIVGIGYPDSKMQLSLRARDYTPTENNDEIRTWLKKVSPNPGYPIAFRGTGGAGKFLAFIEKELQPYIQNNYKIDTLDSTLVGFSFGGLFGLYTLFNKPGLFRRYIIGSPSIYWDNKVSFQLEDEYAGNHRELKARVFISVGALETEEPEPARMVQNMVKMTEILESRNYDHLETISHIFEDETHLSVIPATMSRGLRSVFQT